MYISFQNELGEATSQKGFHHITEFNVQCMKQSKINVYHTNTINIVNVYLLVEMYEFRKEKKQYAFNMQLVGAIDDIPL